MNRYFYNLSISKCGRTMDTASFLNAKQQYIYSIQCRAYASDLQMSKYIICILKFLPGFYHSK